MKDPVILLTGAGKGIGKAIAEELCSRARASNGTFAPKLFLTARTESDLKALQASCRQAGVTCEIMTADIADLAQVEAVASHCLKVFGTIDCLINNAGVGRFGEFTELTAEDLNYVLATNLTGTFVLTQRAYAVMEKKKSGHIVFITSIAAEKPFEQSAIYCISKFGQKGLFEVLRLYGHKNNIRVTNVMPGAVLTPMWGPVDSAMSDRMMRPEDIAKPVVEAILLPERASLEEILIRPVRGDL